MKNQIKRPAGITVLSVLYLLGGFGALAALFVGMSTLIESLNSIGVSSIEVLFSSLIMAFLAFGGAYGMWVGEKWGWWLGVLFLVFSSLKSINALILIPEFAAQYGATDAQLSKQYVKFIGRIFFNFLFIIYFFSKTVEEYFQLGNISKSKRILKLVWISLLIVVSSILVILIGFLF